MHGSGASNQNTEMAMTPETRQEIQTLIETATSNLTGRIAELERVVGESRPEAATLLSRLTAQEQATVNLAAMMSGPAERQ